MSSSMLDAREVCELENEIVKARTTFFTTHGKYPTRIFLDRTRYMKLIMTEPFLSQLNHARTLYAMELYQAVPIFGSAARPLLEVLE